MTAIQFQNLLKYLLTDQGAQRLYAVYHAQGGDMKLVGGCVRDALSDKPVGDIDLATPVLPEVGMQWLRDADITVKETGVAHGTFTAIVDGKPYEITTLRKDIKTDGRHAEVEFGTSWLEDAQRRDLTINGLFCGFNGQVYDCVGGLDDLEQGHIRFIGDAATRCREDYLRILRLFRFWARFGKGDIDKETLAAVQETAPGLANLSPQRVWSELKKLLALPRVAEACRQMQTAHILPFVFDTQAFHLKQLNDLLSVEKQIKRVITEVDDTRALRHLVVLTIQVQGANWQLNWQDLSERFMMSGKETDYMESLSKFGAQAAYWQERPLAALFNFGRHLAMDASLLSAVTEHLSVKAASDMLELLAHAPIPVVPVMASDLLARGYHEGPLLGEALNRMRDHWLDSNCQAGKDECLVLIQ
jgi:poly(A) polymerase